MSFDVYGSPLAPGHCEVHPGTAHPYPCPCCLAPVGAGPLEPEPVPCEGCWYAIGVMQECDGSCAPQPTQEETP